MSSKVVAKSPDRKADRFNTMSISSAPAATARRISSTRVSWGPRPDGNAPATLATSTPVPARASAATGTMVG